MLGKGFVSALPSLSSHSRGPGDQDREAAPQSKQRGAAVQVTPAPLSPLTALLGVQPLKLVLKCNLASDHRPKSLE